MNDNKILRDDLFKDLHAWEDNRQLIPFQPTAVAAKSLEDSPYFLDYSKNQEQQEYERKVRAGQILPTYQGNNQFSISFNPKADKETFVESGVEVQTKQLGTIGWGERSKKYRDALLNFFDGKTNTYAWNPYVENDPSNSWNEWSYWGEVGEGISKIFSTPEDKIRLNSLIEKMDQRDPSFDEARRIGLTDEFLNTNPELARYLNVAGVDLYDYTRGAVSDLGLKFRIHQAVIDSVQSVKLGEFSSTYSGLEQFGTSLFYGIQDPMLARDLAITTALTLGLGTIEVGAARLGMSLGQTTVAGARAMAVARATQKALQLTSPFTGLAEGVTYAGIRAAAPTVGKSALATTLARAGAIATEASIQSVLSAYEDQRHEYEWRSLVFRGKDDAAFKPDWEQLAIQGAIGAGMGTAMMGVMRFAVGGFGDLQYIRKGGWEAFKKNLAGSFDTWATTADGLTVWGDRLSQGRGVLFGDMVDNYMARSVDNRNLANIMVNGQRLFSRTVFNPTVAAKANFNMEGATNLSNKFADTLGLPSEYIQDLPPTSVERVLFDNLTDPEYLANAGLTYKEATDIIDRFKSIEDRVAVLPEADPVMAKLLTEAKGNPKLAKKLEIDNRLLALADIFDIDYVNKQLQRAGVSFDKVNAEFRKITATDIDFGSKIHREAYRELGRFAANGIKWSTNLKERLKYVDPMFTSPLKIGDVEIGADTLRTALRSSLDMDNRKSSIFLTDGFLDKDPTGVVEIMPDGMVKVHKVEPDLVDGKIVMKSDAFSHPDYKPENILGIDGVNRTFETWKNKVTTELKKLEEETKAKVDEEIEESVPVEVFADLGKLPTKQVLMRHFDLSGPEATVASMMMETLGMDIKKVVLKIVRAKGKTLERMEAAKAVGAIEWRDIKSGVAALLSTAKGADFGTLVHEMGHYNRMLFIGDSAEHVELRHKLGITDDAWKKFTDWLGYEGPWENDIAKMTPEQRKAEEKFANAWAYYIRSIMFGDGKTNESSLHRLFSALGDHLGEMGKKMQTQDEMDKSMNFDVFAKAVYDKLFLRSEGRVTEFWESAVSGVFKNMPQADRERLGEAILGTELWNSHKAKIQKGRIEAEAKIAPLTPKVTRVSRADLAKSLKDKMNGQGLPPSQKSIRDALKAGKTLDEIEQETRELWTKLQSDDQTVWEDSPLRPTSDMNIRGHVEDLTDEQLQSLQEGKRLKPINGVVRLVYNPDTKKMDVGFPVIIVTKEKIDRELVRRKARATALKNLRESRKNTKDPVAAAEDVTNDPVVSATTIETPRREEPTSTVEGVPSTEQTILHDVADAKASSELGVTDEQGTPVLDITPDEAVEHSIQVVQREAAQESLQEMNEIVPVPSANEEAVISQAVTVRENARAELEAIQQSLPVQVSTRAVIAVAASRANDVPVDQIIRELLGGEPLSADMITRIEDYRILEDRFINIMNKTEGLGDLTQEDVDTYNQLSLETKTILEEASVVERVQAGVPIQDLVGPTKVSLKDIKAFVDYTTKRQTALKRVAERKLQKQLNENKKAFDRYTELQSIENKTPEQLAEIKSLKAGAGKYRSAAEQLGLMDAKEIVRRRVDEDFAISLYKKHAERSKTEVLVGRAKPNTIKTDEDFAVRLIANITEEGTFKLKEDRFWKIAIDNDLSPEQMLSNIYRDGNLIGWFKEAMNVKDLTNEETFNLVLAWNKREQSFPVLAKKLKTRAKTKQKENVAYLGETKRAVSGEDTDKGSGVFSRTESRTLSDREDQAADALISLFVDHLKSKDHKLRGGSKLSLADYFLARRQASDTSGGVAQSTIAVIKEATGISISDNIVENLAEKVQKEADVFFKDVAKDPDLSKYAKELIENRFGIKIRKAKESPAETTAKELFQSPVEEQIGNDLRKLMHNRKIKNARDVLKYISESQSEFATIAKFLQDNSSQDALGRIAVIAAAGDARPINRGRVPLSWQEHLKRTINYSAGYYDSDLNLLIINNDVRGFKATVTSIHEIVHGLTVAYLNTVVKHTDQFGNVSGLRYWNSLLAAEKAQPDGWVKNLLSSYIDAIQGSLTPDQIKQLNVKPTPNVFLDPDLYGLFNIKEFLSESFSEKQFMELLDTAIANQRRFSTAIPGTYKQIFSTVISDSVLNQVSPTLLDVFTSSVKLGMQEMAKKAETAGKAGSAEWRLKKSLSALSTVKFQRRADRVNAKDPAMLMQTQLKAIADLKASKGRLYQGLRQKAIYEMTLDEIFETPEFKDWFGDSKVVDTMGIYKPGSGKPMIMYHGTRYAGFTAFRNPDFSESRSDQLYGAGIYLTDDPEIASSYTSKESKAVFTINGQMFFIPATADELGPSWFENSTFGRIIKESLSEEEANEIFASTNKYLETRSNGFFWRDFKKLFKNPNQNDIRDEIDVLSVAIHHSLYYNRKYEDPRYQKLLSIWENDWNSVFKLLEDLGFTPLPKETGEGVYPVFVSIQKPVDVDNDLFNIRDFVSLLKTKKDQVKWKPLKNSLTAFLVKNTIATAVDVVENGETKLVSKYWSSPDLNNKNTALELFMKNPLSWWMGEANPLIEDLIKLGIDQDRISDLLKSTINAYNHVRGDDDNLHLLRIYLKDKDLSSFRIEFDLLINVFIEELGRKNLPMRKGRDEFKELVYKNLGFSSVDAVNLNKQTNLFKLFPHIRETKVDHLFIQLLQEMGYDGLTHIGGRHMGHKDHRVFIAWNNIQVKSRFNKGGFSKTKSNMLLQEPSDVQLPKNAIGIDSTGKPITLYHSSEGTGKWDKDKLGLWFSSDEHISKKFGKSTYKAYTSLTKDNTFVVDTVKPYAYRSISTSILSPNIYKYLAETLMERAEIFTAEKKQWEELLKSSDRDIIDYFQNEILDQTVSTDAIAIAAKKAGYRGVWFKNIREWGGVGDQWIIFDKESIIPIKGENILLLQEPPDVQPLIDAVDLRRRKLKELGLNEEMDTEELNMIGRILNGLEPVDVSDTTILERVGTTFTPSQIRKISSAFDGTDYRSLSDNERRTFILESVIPKIRAAMGDRNSTNGFYSAFSSSDMGKRVNSLIGGAVDYGDTADSNSILVQFISKIFDPLMDMRDGEIMNKFEMPSVDRINAERNNILMRIGLTRFTDKIAATVKEFKDRKMINDTAWLYLTRPEELPAGIAHRDLILEAIKVINEFNRIRVDLLQKNKLLSKNIDYTKYGTSHRANRYAEANQAAFVDAMNDVFVRRTRESNQLSIITASALGWVDLKRNTATDEIMAIRVPKDSPLAKLMPEEKLLDKWVDWEGRIRKAFDDKTVLPKDIQDIHDRGLVSIDDYTQSWKDAYGSRVGKPYTALRQAAEVAKNRYLGIDYGDSKASSPRRQSIGEGRNYNEERIFSHDEIVRDKELSKFFRNDLFGLLNDDINTQILDAMMTRELTKFFGARMSMTDLMEILATTGEEIMGRKGLSQEDIESRTRGYERLRNSWNRAIGIIDSDKDSIDKYAKVVLRNSRIPLTLASSLRAAVTSLPELARALLTSNKNRPMLMQFLPNMVKLAKGVTKNRRQARYQIISGTHWLRGLATDHILNRESMDPENPFGGTVFGENAGGMASNFINGWRVAGERNKYETNWLQRVANRVAPVSSAVGAPLAFVNDMSTLLHIWNAQENITTNLASFRKMAAMLEKDPTTDMAKFAAIAKQCGLAPQEALNLSTSGLLKTKYIDILAEAAKNQTLYSDGILDSSKLYAWAGDNPERLEAISMIGGYINSTVRLTNVEPTLLDIRVGQSLFGLVMRQYMQFFLSMGVQEIGRRRRSTAMDYTHHLAGLLLMEVVAYGTSRALADPMDDDMGGLDEFEKNPLDYTVRTLTGLPLLGSYAWLSQVFRHTIMGASELVDGPGAEQEFRLPDLLGGPASSAPRRLGNIPNTAAAYYEALQELLED